jgi:hypothetical protein
LLADDVDGQQVWSVTDLARQISNPDDASLAVRGLHAAGLLNQTSDGFVVATRAGIRAVATIGAVSDARLRAPRRRAGRGARGAN